MIHILLPVYNRREVTHRLIRCLRTQTYQDYHLILVDDGSTDGTEEMVRSEIKSLTVIKGKGNWWWGGCLHQGYLWLKSNRVPLSDFVLMMNDDTEFENDFLEKGLKVYGERSRTLLQAQCYSQQTGKLIDMGVRADWNSMRFNLTDKIEEINCLSTRGLLFRQSDFLEIGGFYPNLLPHYTSDFEFTLRAYRKGMKLTTDPFFKLWVDEETTGTFQMNHSESVWIFLKKMFSKKNATNPVVFTAFVALACPWRWKFPNLYRVWKGAVWHAMKSIEVSIKNYLT